MSESLVEAADRGAVGVNQSLVETATRSAGRVNETPHDTATESALGESESLDRTPTKRATGVSEMLDGSNTEGVSQVSETLDEATMVPGVGGTPDRAVTKSVAGVSESLVEAAEALVALDRVVRLLRRSGDAGALGHGATSALGTLVTGGPMRLGDLAAAEHVTAPTMSRIVSGLAKLGYVRRAADPGDGRAQVLTATEEAFALVNGYTSARVRQFASVLDELGADERAALVGTLAEIIARLEI
ncbi:MarR family winged helix-turn-helix transcriptional regulator [Nocardia sp. NPDC004068]|uniref:MarR family winged helix-turn-helix transcriptional regulator n=1 Tax=Nocardia sp. NPDC004068 TaxID=3364303 RepID=UPI0036B20963